MAQLRGSECHDTHMQTHTHICAHCAAKHVRASSVCCCKWLRRVMEWNVIIRSGSIVLMCSESSWILPMCTPETEIHSSRGFKSLWVFPFYETLYIYIFRLILHFFLHHIYVTALITSYYAADMVWNAYCWVKTIYFQIWSNKLKK